VRLDHVTLKKVPLFKNNKKFVVKRITYQFA